MNSVTGEALPANNSQGEEVISPEAQTEVTWAALAKLPTEALAARLPSHFEGLSTYAVSREGIYAEDP